MIEDFFTVNFNPKRDTILPRDWCVKPYTDSIVIHLGYELKSLFTENKSELIKTHSVELYLNNRSHQRQIWGCSAQSELGLFCKS